MLLKRNPEIKSQLLPDGHLVLFNEKTQWAHILNPAGALFWELCDGCCSQDEAIAMIQEILADNTPKELPQEIYNHTKELVDAGLLQALN